MNPLLAQLSHRAFPDISEAIRLRISQITCEWVELSKEAMPQLDRLTFGEMQDSTPTILEAIADAMESDDSDLIQSVLTRSPAQGLSRFRQRYDVIVVLQEDRLLRAVIVTQVEAVIGRQMSVAEAAALHATVDVMLQQSVIALVGEQQAELREASERELKYLSFLSHDLNNNLGGVTLMLKLLRDELVDSGISHDAVELLDDAQKNIHDTVGGMWQLLEHERLRKVGVPVDVRPLALRKFLSGLVQQSAQEAKSKGLELVVDAEPEAIVHVDSEMLTLVVRNLIGNAIKFAPSGTVRVGAKLRKGEAALPQWTISVADEGPGIAPENVTRIFKAIERGKTFGQEGVGLGLAVASQAAKLLDAHLSVESNVGEGSQFHLRLPPHKPVGAGTKV